ncbi:hypothetical protein ACFL6H_03460 [Candidatus Latescibacterota bacterium]
MKNSNTVYMFVVCMLLSTYSYTQVYTRAPEVLPWIQPQMHDPNYWISRMEQPDEIILTSEEIERMNDDYIKRISSPEPFKNLPDENKPDLFYWWPGMVTFVPDFHSISARAVADTVKLQLKAQINYLRSMTFGNALAVEYSQQNIDAIEYNMAYDLVKDTVDIRDGITVTNTRLRSNTSFFPEQVGMMQTGKSRWDGWNIGIIKIGQPLVALHHSRSGEYLFVLCDIGYGWVRSEDVAFGTKQSIDDFVNSGDFIVCTGDRVQFYTDENCTFASGWFGMGTCLPLVSKANPRIIKVPVRKMNGQFTIETAWLRDSRDVHIGWVPYTCRNIVNTAFKLLGTTYDWSGAWYGRQHETTYRDIFACFGFKLPNYGALFSFYGNDTDILHPEVGTVQQFGEILTHEPFVTIQTCGSHAQLLLGDYKGTPIVFDQHGYGYVDSNSIDREIRRCNIGDMRLPPYFLTKNITFLTLK